MNNAKLYHNSNELQRREAEDVLREYFHLVEWSTEGVEKILDVGCGDGDVTVNILEKRLPQNYHQLTGVDVSSKMIKYANAMYDYPKIDFKVMDISALPGDNEVGAYHHVFSFYCLHWVQNQKDAIQNMYNLLKSGGDCLFTLTAKNPMFDVYERLGNMSKWEPYMKDYKKFASPYHKSADPVKELTNYLLLAGFKVVRVHCKRKTFFYSGFQNLRDSLDAVNPFLDRIPKELHDDYFDDLVGTIRESNFIEDNNNEGEKVRINTVYDTLIAYAVK